MKFIIIESNHNNQELNDESLTQNQMHEFVKKNCSQFLEESRELFIYRGMILKGKNPKKYLIKIPRTDRKPMDMPKEWNDYLDEKFEEKFGWAARSSGLFGTSDGHWAKQYGKPYNIYPIDGYKYIWSPDTRDLYVKIRHYVENYDSDEEELGLLDIGDPNTDPEFFGYLDDLVGDYKDNNLIEAIRSGNEIMFKCDRYAAVLNSPDGDPGNTLQAWS